jgi:cytoskeletal protein RodZ
MGSVASDLKLEREKRRISLAQISADTRISIHHLQNLEEGRYNDLPGGIYNRAFLKAYCESINIDQLEVLQRYEAEIAPPFEKPPKAKALISERATPFRPTPIVTWSVMLLISATGLFFSRNWISGIFAPYFSHSPVSNVRYEHAPEPPSASASQMPVSATMSPTLKETMKPPPSVQASSAPDNNHPVPKTPKLSPKENIQSATEAIPSLRLEFAVTEKCWISVDSDGSSVIRTILEPGEVKSFSADENFLIVVGNAGGVQLKLNGRPVRPLGRPGEVIKMIINAENLQDLVAQTAG